MLRYQHLPKTPMRLGEQPAKKDESDRASGLWTGGGSSHAGAIAMATKDHNSVWQPSHLLTCEWRSNCFWWVSGVWFAGRV